MNEKILSIINSLGIPVGQYSDDGEFSGTTADMYKLPENIGELSDKDISELLSKHAEWACFLSARLAEQEANLIYLRNERKKLEDSLLIDAEGSSVRAKKASARTNETYRNLDDAITTCESVVAVIKAHAENENRRYANLSRQITARSNDIERVTRVDNVNKLTFGQKSVRR
jgi:DNA-binding phage protein